MEKQIPTSGFLPAGGRPARNPEITQQLQYYPNAYDKGYREGINQAWNRSANQSGWEQLGYGLVSRSLSIIPKIGAGFGAIGGGVDALIKQDITKIWDNPVMEWFNSLDESLKENLPVYSSRKNDTSGLLGKMSTSSFWASDAFDGIAYAASAYVPGALIGKLVEGASLGLKATQIGKRVYDGLKYVGYAGEEGQLAHRASLIASSAYNVISEAAAEAFQTQKELEAIYEDKKLDPKVAKQKAAEAAARVFNGNLGVLAVPDLIQNMFFHGGWNKLTGAVRKSIWDKGTAEGVKQLADSWLKNVGISIGSEGFWEENIQTTFQQWEKNAAKSGNDGSKRTEEIASNYVNNIGSFFKSFIGVKQTPDEIEAATSIFLGGVIGGLAATRGHIQDKKALNKLATSELDRYNFLGEAGRAAEGIFTNNVGSIYKTNGKKTVKSGETNVEINDYQLDAKGNTILDENAVNRLVSNSLKNKALWDAHMVAAYTNDEALGELNKHVALASYIHNLMNSSKYQYTAEEINKHLDKLTEIGGEEAKQLGVDTYISTNMDLAKQYAKQLEAIQGKHTSIAKESKQDPKEAAFSDFATKTEFYLEIKKKALESIIQKTTTEKGKDAATKMLDDTNEYLHQIKNERSEIKKVFNKTVIDPSIKLAEYESTKDVERKKKLGYELVEDAGINGNWAATNSSRDLPSVEGRISAKVTPGSRDAYQYGVGKSIITSNRVTAALGANEDISDIADQFANGIKVIPDGNNDLINAQQQEILSKLDTEHARVLADAETIARVLAGKDSIELDVPVGDAFSGAFFTTDKQSNLLLAEINSKGAKFTPESSSTEVVQSPQFAEFLSESFEKLKTAGLQLGNITRLKDKVTNMDLTNKRLDEYQKTADKELFLKKEFYNDYIKENAEKFIKTWEEYPELMKNDQKWKEYNDRLELAFTSDVDEVSKDADEKLDIFAKIWQTILHNINNAAEIHNIVNTQITNSILESLPIEAISKVLEVTTVAPQATIADIERRMQEELNRFPSGETTFKKINPDGANTEVTDKQKATIERVIDGNIKDGKTPAEIVETLNKAGYAVLFGNETITLINYLEDRISGAITTPFFEFNNKLRDKINAKYDAELVTAKSATQLVVGGLEGFINKIQTQDDVTSFDAIISLLDAVKKTSTEITEQTKASIKDSIDLKVAELIKILDVKYPELSKFTNIYKSRGDIQNEIYLPTLALLAKHFSTKYGDEALPSEFVRFQADLDIFLFFNSIAKSRTADNEDKELVRLIKDIYFDAIGASIATNILDSTLNVPMMQKFKEDMKVTPSLQQNIALTQAITFLNSKQSFTDFGGWLLVRGIGGSGKTFFIGNQLKQLSDELLVRESKILAFSKEDGTSANINKSIFGDKAPVNTFNSFNIMGDDVLAQLDFIVIDEIFTFSNAELNNIRERCAKAKVKVIALGDSSQLTVEEKPAPLGAIHINMTIPLTTSYRTNVSAISSFIEEYRLNPHEVTAQVASSNVSIEDLVSSPSTAYGVISLTPEQLDVALHTPSSRSRVLIVESERAKSNLQSRYPTLEIRTVEKAQGLQWDEVYTMLDTNLGKTDFESNRVLYTAFSRAKSLLIVTDPKVTNAKPTTELETQVLNSDNEMNKIKEMFSINLQGVKDLRDLLNGVQPFSTEETSINDVTYEFELPTDASVSNAMGTELIVDLPELPTQPTAQKFAFPRNYGLANWGNPGDERLAKGSTVHFIKTIDTKGNISFFVVGENQHRKGHYFEIAKLSREDLEGSAKLLLNEITKSTKEPIDESEIKGKDEFPIPYMDRISSGSVTITDYQKFKTIYTPTYHSDKNMIAGAKDIIEDAVIRAWLGYVDLSKPNDKPWVTLEKDGYNVNWDNIPDKAVTMLIPTKKDTEAQDGFGWRNQEHVRRRGEQELSVYYGVPYLVVRLEGTTKKPMLIRFQPKMLNVNHRYVSTLRELQTSVSTIERITGMQLGTIEFATLIRDYAQTNYSAESGELQLIDSPQPIPDVPQSTELEDAVRDVVKLLFKAKNEPVYYRSEEKAKEELEKNGTPIDGSEDKLLNGKRIVSISKSPEGTWVYNWSTDPTDKASTEVYTAWKISEGHGDAQIALNTLAKANNRAGGLQFRQYRITKKDAKVDKIVFAPSILKDISEKKPFIDYASLYKDPFLLNYLTQQQIDSFGVKSKNLIDNPNLGYKLQDALVEGIKAKEGATHSEAVEFAMFITEHYMATPITSSYLNTLVGQGAFDANGEHTSLRTPLFINTGSKTKTGVNDLGENLKGGQGTDGAANRAKLTSNIRHNFEGFQKTEIFYDHPLIPVIEAPKVETRSSSIRELIATVKPTGVKTYDDIVELIKRLNIDSKVITLPNGIPVINELGEREIVKKEGFATVVDNGIATIYSYPHNFEDVHRNINKLHYLLHESLHVASKIGLEQGAQDAANKLDTKEAIFYRRIQALQKRFNAAVRAKRDPITNKRIKLSEVYEDTFSKLDVNEFVANLSNPKFVELAKTISVTSESKFLRKILEAIVDFFKSILGGNPSVYDAAIASLEDFYSNPEIVRSLPELIQPESVFKPEELLTDLTKQVDAISEFTFEYSIDAIKQKWGHIIDVSSLPSEYGDDFKIQLNPNFEKLTPIEQSLILSQASISGAWYDTTKDRITYSTGAIGTTQAIPFALNKLMEKEEFNSRQKSLITSIVRQEALGKRNLDEIIVSDINKFIDLLFDDEKGIFSNKDKQYFRVDFNTNTDLQSANFIKDPNNNVIPAFDRVLQFIKDNDFEIKKIIVQSGDRATSRYRIAKQYVEGIIKANLDLDTDLTTTQLIQTTPFVRQRIQQLVNHPNPILSSGITLVEGLKKLEQLYAEVKNYKKSSADPYEKNKILYIEIPQLENEITAIKALGTKDSTTGDLVIDLIFKDIYPNSDFSELQTWQEELYRLAEEEHISKSDVELEISGISEHIKNYSQSYESTLSESLKNSFRKITLGNKVISPGLAYIKTMEIVMSLDWNITTNEGVNPDHREIGLPYIRRQLNDILMESTSTLTKLIIENLLKNLNYSLNNSFLDGVSLKFGDKTLGVVQVKMEDNTIGHAVYSADSSLGIEGLTYKQIEYLQSQGKDIWLSNLSKDTTKLYEELYKHTPHSIQQFNRLFTKGDAINTMRAVMNTMASMKKTDLYIANRSNNKGHEFRFQHGTASGVTMGIKDQLKANLRSLYEKGDLPALAQVFHSRTVGGVAMSTLKETKKLEYIKNFFDFLGVAAPDIEVRGKGINNLINQIEGFLERTSDVKPYTLADDLGDVETNIFDIDAWLDYGDGVDGYISKFRDVLETSSKLVRNQSVRAASGEKFYVNHEASHIYRILNNLIAVDSGNSVFKGGSGTDFNRVIPDWLKSEERPDGTFIPSYYDHNIFVRGKTSNKLHQVIEIDGARNLGNNSVTEYTRENMFFFFHRNFSQQFVDGIRQNKNTYFQSTFIPSDSPKALAVKVNVLSDSETDNGKSPILLAVEQMFKQLLPRQGLNGAKFSNFDNSIRDDLFRDFKLGAKALRDAKDENGNALALTEENIPQLARFVYAQMSIDAEALLDELMSSNVQLSLDSQTFLTAQRLLAHRSNNKDIPAKLNSKLFPIVTKGYGTVDNPTPATTKDRKGNYVVDKDLLLPLFDLWFKNSYVNSYFLNQLVMGDYAAYKNSESQVKRFGGVKGPTIGPLIDPTIGMRSHRNVLALGDKINTREDAAQFFSNLLYGDNVPEHTPELDKIVASLPKNFKPTDAQGLITNKWQAELSRGYESSWGLGAASKPLHFGTERETIGDYTTAKPIYNKYSATVLDDAMTSKFPRLAQLRRVLEFLDIDEAIHETGIKLGVPITKDSNGNDIALPTMEDLLNYTDEQLLDLKNNWKVSPIMRVSNVGYGLQFNAASDPNKSVSLFTQLMYFLNTYPDKLSVGEFETTQDAAKEVYNLVGELMQMGREDFFKKVGTTKQGLTDYLKKNLKGAGSERALTLLEAGVSIDNPLIEKKAIISLASGLEKAAIKTKFKGGKLILQTPEGVTNPHTGERLMYRRETLPNGTSMMVAEVIVPKEMLTKEQIDAVNRGETMHLMPDMLGFRLPSTEFHSALAMRVVGTYSTKKSNIIICPRELVPISGQDFDVDALFVITQETYKDSETSLVNPANIVTFTEILHELLHELRVAEYNVSKVDPKFKALITNLRKEIKVLAGLATDPQEDVEATLEGRVAAIIKKFDELPEELKETANEIVHHIIRFKRLITKEVIGSVDAPVGYTKVDGKYQIDTTFLQKVNESLKAFQSVTTSKELMPSLDKIVRTEITKLKSLKQKYIKNRVIDIMMSVVSDSNNASRSFSAITFTPLDDAIKNISEREESKNLVVSNDNLDLSHPKDQFLAYLSVSSAETLIGAFANASKWFGYVARAGSTSVTFSRMTALKRAEKQLGINSDFNAAELLLPLYKDTETINKLVSGNVSLEQIKELMKVEEDNPVTFKVEDVLPSLNSNQAFSIQENGKSVLYNKLSRIDSDGVYRITDSIATLTNAAVDDLNEGYLSRGRINTNTGSTIIGLLTLGVPFRIAIKILYQPVLAQLSEGKINNLDRWVESTQKEMGMKLEIASEEPLNVEQDLDRFLYDISKHEYQNMDLETMFSKMSPQDQRSQLRVLAIFIKATKVGQDGRSLASFLNILRESDVFIEDIEQLDDNLTDNIGTPVTLPSGELVLQTRKDFSFDIPNLFEGSRHIKEAYITHTQLKSKIHDSFLIHSSEITELSSDINRLLDLKDTDNKNAKLNSIRHALQQYVTVGLESDKLPPAEIISYKDTKMVSSGANVFLNRTASALKDIKDYAKEIGDDNLFLQNVVVVPDKYNTFRISFRNNIGLNPDDQLDIVKGFRELNEYTVIDGKVSKIVPDSPDFISRLQHDLLRYSVLTSGLQYGGTSFASYITPQLIQTLDERVNAKLQQLRMLPKTLGFMEHFTLSYTLINPSKLGYFTKDELLPIAYNENTKKSTYAGRQIIDDKKIFFDLRAKRRENKKGELIAMPTYVRRGFGKDTTVHRLVHTTDQAAYYQVVGKANNVVFRPVGLMTDFSLKEQFNPFVPSIYYHYIQDDKFVSFSPLLNSLAVGDVAYIYPSSSYDRMERQHVVIVSKVSVGSKTIKDLKGTEVTFKVVPELTTINVEGTVISSKPIIQTLEIQANNSIPTPPSRTIIYPETLPSEEAVDYITRLKSLDYTDEQIGEALKQQCK